MPSNTKLNKEECGHNAIESNMCLPYCRVCKKDSKEPEDIWFENEKKKIRQEVIQELKEKIEKLDIDEMFAEEVKKEILDLLSTT